MLVWYTWKPPIPLPYVKGVSEQLRKTFKDHGVDCYFKPTNCLRQLLCSPKYPTKKGDTVGAIYHVRCLGSTGVDCDSTCIDETERALAKRIAEHLRQSSVTKSEVVTHIHKDCPHHSVSMETVAVLDRDKDWYRSGVREAIYIRVNKPDLNRDQGRTRLGTHYCSHACRSLKDLDRVTVVIVIKALVRAESSVFLSLKKCTKFQKLSLYK